MRHSVNSHQQPENADQAMEELQISQTLKQITYKILVFSGKGGVGKSTASANLAVALALAGKKVGLLDIDFHGPSIPKLMGLVGRRPDMIGEKILPLSFSENLLVLSLGMLLNAGDDAVIWRGPMKNGAIRQLIKDVAWGELDYLIVDSPPGTGDEPLSLVQTMQDLSGAIVVTQPQQLSVDDVRRSISFCEKLNLPVIGIIENMSGFVCPNCGSLIDIFKSGGGQQLAEEKNILFLGKVPIDPAIVESSDEGKPFVYHFGKSPAAQAFDTIVNRVVQYLEVDVPARAQKEQEHSDVKKIESITRFAMPLENGMVSAHFGHASQFSFIDYDRAKNVALKIEQKTPPPHEQGVIPKWIADEKVDVLFTGGIGHRAREILEGRGVTVVSGVPQGKPLNLISKYLKGELETSDNMCDH
ncbi:chromosome partitioning protein ParA [candidate division KSB1 bacterium]|nr:P-loop NTPase [candidate division KSB1 bacterium]RQW06132.1 MAG: chromosome partitioning protein ParA [candidate division KSB1 bacterium]